MSPFSSRTLIGLAVAGLVLRMAGPLGGCDGCSAEASGSTDLLVGLGLLGGLVWAATWLEKASFKDAAVHLGGLGAAAWFVWSLGGSLAG